MYHLHGLLLAVADAALCSQAILSAAQLGDATQLALSLENELASCQLACNVVEV